MRERLFYVSALQMKTLPYGEILTGALRTPCVTQRDIDNGKKKMETKPRKSHENYFCLIQSHGLDKKCYSHSCLCRGILECVAYVTPFVDCAMDNKV